MYDFSKRYLVIVQLYLVITLTKLYFTWKRKSARYFICVSGLQVSCTLFLIYGIL